MGQLNNRLARTPHMLTGLCTPIASANCSFGIKLSLSLKRCVRVRLEVQRSKGVSEFDPVLCRPSEVQAQAVLCSPMLNIHASASLKSKDHLVTSQLEAQPVASPRAAVSASTSFQSHSALNLISQDNRK